MGRSRTMTKRRGRKTRKWRRRRLRTAVLAPQKKVVKCLAVQHWSHTGHTSGTMDMTPVQMNSVLDVFTSQGAQQPLGFDQWRALYEYGYVIGAKISVTFHNADAFSYIVGVCPMNLAQGTTSLANYEYYGELKGNRFILLTPDVDKTTITSRVSLKKWLRVKDILDTNEYRMNLNTPSEPSKLAYWHVYSQPTNQASTDTSGVEIVCKVSYIILLNSPIVPARSVV